MDSDLKPSRIVAVFPLAVERGGSSRQGDLCRGAACFLQRRLSRLSGVDARLQTMVMGSPDGDVKGWVLTDATFSPEQAQSYPFPPGFEPTHVLHGFFHWTSREARVELVLIDMEAGLSVARERVEGPVDEAYEGFLNAVGAMAAQLLDNVSAGRLAARAPSRSHDAFEKYLLGLAGLQGWNRGMIGPETAFHFLNRALELDPEFSEAAEELERLADISLRAGERDRKIALSALEKAVKLAPGASDLCAVLGLHLIQGSAPDRGVALLRRVVDEDPFSRHGGAAFRALARFLRSEGQRREARGMLLRAVRANPEDAAAWEDLGYLYEEMGAAGKAEGAWLRALQEDPDRSETLTSLGGAWLGKRRYEEAVPLLERAVAMPGSHDLARRFLVECYVEIHKPEEADSLATAWVEEQPDDFHGWMKLAEVRRLLAQEDAAKYCVDRASALAETPDHRAALMLEELAIAHPGAHEEFRLVAEEAGTCPGEGAPLLLRRLEPVLGLAGPLPPAVDRLAAQLHEKAGNWSGAASHQERVARFFPAEHGEWTHLADLRDRAGQHDGVGEALGRALELLPGDARLRFRMAQWSRAGGRRDEALAFLRQAMELDPKETSYRRALIQWGQEDLEPAPGSAPSADAAQAPPGGFLQRLRRFFRK